MKYFIKNNHKFLFIAGLFLFLISPIFCQEDFSSFMEEETTAVLQWSGAGSLNTRYYADYQNLPKSIISVYPEIDLNLDYSSERSEFHGRLNISGIPNFQMIDEAWFQMFFNNFNIETGYMKIIWGKGDKGFTFDNLNAIDYTDFINPSYLDRKIAEAMIKINIPFGLQGMVEAVYIPVFTPDKYPEGNDDWYQNKYEDMEDVSKIENSQLGLRILNSPLGIDLGLSYQYTFIREPVVDSEIEESLTYDRVHLFGFETAFVILGFNIRSEAAYYMTHDLPGDDPLVHNNKALFLLGFDRDLLIHNLSINIQGSGEIKLGSDNIKVLDIEYDSEGEYKSYQIIGGLKDSFFNERITAELNGTYTIEDKDFMIIPELRINLMDDTWFNMKYTFFYGNSDTLYGQFANNDFLEIKMEYSF